MTGLFDKIKKRAGFKEKADAKSAEVEFRPLERKEDKAKTKIRAEKMAPTKTEEKNKKDIFGKAYKVLVRPVVSEKASIAASMNAYTFVVWRDADKNDVKQAIKQIYGISPAKVRIINMEGKKMRTKAGVARRGDWKKAIVTLPQGQSINVHEGV